MTADQCEDKKATAFSTKGAIHRLAEARVEWSSQRIIVTDDQCKNTKATAFSTKGANHRQFKRSTCSGTIE